MTINQFRICAFIAAYANGQIPVVPIQVVPAPIDPIVIAPSTIPINPTVATVTNIILQSTTTEPLSITETATLSLSTAIAPDWVDTTVIGVPASQKELNDWFTTKPKVVHSGGFSRSICGTMIAALLYLF